VLAVMFLSSSLGVVWIFDVGFKDLMFCFRVSISILNSFALIAFVLVIASINCLFSSFVNTLFA